MSKLILADRINNIKPSSTIAITTKAAELKAQGIDIVSLGAGEPDFDTPGFIKAAAIQAINAGDTKYTAVEGTLALRKAVANKFKAENTLDYTPEQILVSCGAKQSIYNLINVLLQKGDEALIPAPYWVSYPDIVTLTDATSVIIETQKDQLFKISPSLLEKHITNKTKLLILNSPSNPSGQIYTQKELIELAKVLLKYPDIYIISDDIYEHIILTDEKFHNILSACQEEFSADDYKNLYNRTVVINGVSKAYAMTGWRIGYAAGEANLIKAMKKLQSQSTSNPCSIAQAAACEALTNPNTQATIQHMVEHFKKRQSYVHQQINSMPGLSSLEAAGAFYTFVDCSEAIKARNLRDDVELAEQLLTQANLAMISGSAFGTPNYLRLSYATSMEVLQCAMERLRNFLNK